MARTSLLLSVLCLLFACTDPVKVTVVSNGVEPFDTLVFDGEDTLIMQGGIDSIRLNGPASHTCTINGKRTLSFNLGEAPGMLNIDSSAFVVFTVEYTRADAHEGPHPTTGHVLIDSFLVQRRFYKDQVLNDTAAQAVLDGLHASTTGNYATVHLPFGERALKTYDASTDVFGVRYIAPDKHFVRAFWDFDIGEEIPSSITESVREDMAQFDKSRTKKGIMRTQEFLLLAMLDPDQYVVTDVRHLLKGK